MDTKSIGEKMGFNFRKRIRLGKLFNLNIGKSGASISFGAKGFRQSFSTRGSSRTTFSLPGTGLSYSKAISAKSILKKFGNRDVFKSTTTSADPETQVNAYREDIALITTLHHFEDYPSGIDWEQVKTEKEPFEKGKPGPHTKEAMKFVEENKPGLFARVFAKGDFKDKSKEVLKEAEIMDEELYSAWENNRIIAERMMNEDKDSYLEVLEDLKLSEELGHYIRSMDFSYTDHDSLKVDISLSIDDFIPEEYKALTPTGKLSIKKYTKTEYYDIANQFVSGLVLRTARNLLNILPVEDVFINVWETEKNKYSGVDENQRILSILIDRDTFKKINLEKVNPYDALTNFRHEIEFIKTRGFKEVGELAI